MHVILSTSHEGKEMYIYLFIYKRYLYIQIIYEKIFIAVSSHKHSLYNG